MSRYSDDPVYRAKILAKNKRWRDRNKEKLSEYERTKRPNREERKVYYNQYYQDHKQELVAYASLYRQVYADEHRANAIKYAQENPEQRRSADSRRKQRSSLNLDKFDRALSVEYRKAIKSDPCFYCGAIETHHVDHYFPLAKGGTDHWYNLVRTCATCNLRKNAHCGTWFILYTSKVGPLRGLNNTA